MAKDSYYFSHDYDPTGDPKMQAMIGEYGGMGYGIFWRVVEMLHADDQHKLPLKKYIFQAIAKQMLANAEQVESLLKDCVDVYELFLSDGVHIWSTRVMRNIEKKQKISENRSISGKKGAIAKQKSASAKQNIAKERKGKEIYNPEGGKNKVKAVLGGLAEFEIQIFSGCEAWQYKELVELVTNSEQEFQAICISKSILKAADNFKFILQAFVDMIQSTGEYQTAVGLKRHFGNWLNKKNGTIEAFISELKQSPGQKRMHL